MEPELQELNPHLSHLLSIIRQKQNSLMDGITTTERHEPPLKSANLNNVDCPICGNRGYILRTDENGVMWSRDCECMKKRVSLRNIEDSGLRDLSKRYSFENYETPGEAQRKIKQKAELFVKTDAPFFIISGKSGSGKTHICTAICKALIDDNWKTRYMIWRTDSAKLKSMVNDGPEYRREINRLRNAPVLYIDDFYKGTVTEADINLAFQILNDRYNGSGQKTVISTELPIERLLKIDEAICGRIVERARGYILQAPAENWRLKGENTNGKPSERSEYSEP